MPSASRGSFYARSRRKRWRMPVATVGGLLAAVVAATAIAILAATSTPATARVQTAAEAATAAREAKIQKVCDFINQTKHDRVASEFVEVMARIAVDVAETEKVDLRLLLAVTARETNWRPWMLDSKAPCTGLMQVHQEWFPITEPYGIRGNLTKGAEILKDMQGQFSDWRVAIMAYNLGPANVRAGKTNWSYLNGVDVKRTVTRGGKTVVDTVHESGVLDYYDIAVSCLRARIG
jgi:soluble lytic murein transglycosylase-like protein